MTISQAKQKLIAWANAQVGTREGENNWTRYALGMEKLYGWNVQNQPWCDIFVDAGFVECFGLETASEMTYQFPGCAGAACRYSAQYYKNHSAWFDTPEPGDQIFVYIDGGINHTGIVVDVGGSYVTTVEGNSGDQVVRRMRVARSVNIAGYGRPNWALAAEAEAAAPESPEKPEKAGAQAAPSYSDYEYEVRTNLLRRGNHGPQVENMQHLLTDHGFDCGGIDGQFGDQTAAALRAFQKKAGIGVDGEWGAQSFNAMWNY